MAGDSPGGLPLLYQGLLRSPASWARVGRGYLGALSRLGIECAALSPRGFGYNAAFPIPASIRELTLAEARSLPPGVGLGFLHPPLLGRLLGQFRVNLFVWEADRVPASWVAALAQGADLVLVPSAFTRAALLGSGFPAAKLAVAPYGHEAAGACVAAGLEQGREGAPPPRPFTFLAVMSPHWRKGVRELLGAYRQAFGAGDDVLLKVKSTHDPGSGGRRHAFQIPSWKSVLRECGLHAPRAPRVELDLRILDDQEQLGLYRQADVYVQPSWGESFGLALLEALASGLPAIATGWGGHLDFFEGGADALPFSLVEAGDALYALAPGARAAIPSVEALAARLRWHFHHPGDSRRLGERWQRVVAGSTWLAAGKALLQALPELARSRRQVVKEGDAE